MLEPLPLTSLLVAIPKRLCLFQTLYDSSIRSSLASIGAGSFTKWERPLPFTLPSVPRPLIVRAAQGDELNHAVEGRCDAQSVPGLAVSAPLGQAHHRAMVRQEQDGVSVLFAP